MFDLFVQFLDLHVHLTNVCVERDGVRIPEKEGVGNLYNG
jgi:hypothetical protein